MLEQMILQLALDPDGTWRCLKTAGAGKTSVHEVEVEYRVYSAEGEFYASASGPNAEAEARRYIEQPGDYMTKAFTIEEIF